MMQIGSFDNEEPEPEDLEAKENNIAAHELPQNSRCQALGAQCDAQGKFLPTQCDQDICWCVDEAGNQLPQTSSFNKGEQLCCKFLVVNYYGVSLLTIKGRKLEFEQNLHKVFFEFSGVLDRMF